MFPTAAAGSIVGLSAQLLKGSTSKVTPLSELRLAIISFRELHSHISYCIM
jgi:hypothetical protein